MRNKEFQNIVFSAYDQENKNFNFDKAISDRQEKYKDKVEQLNNQQDVNNQKITGLTSFLELLHKEDVNETYQKELNDLQEENNRLAWEKNTLLKQQGAVAEEDVCNGLDAYMETKNHQATKLYNTLQEQVDDKIKSIQEQAIKTQELFKDKADIAEQIQKDVEEIRQEQNKKMQSSKRYETISEFNNISEAYKTFREEQKRLESIDTVENNSESELFMKYFKDGVSLAKEFFNEMEEAFELAEKLYKDITKDRNIKIPSNNKLSFSQILWLDVLDNMKSKVALESTKQVNRYNSRLGRVSARQELLAKLFNWSLAGSVLITSTGKITVSHHDLLLMMWPEINKVNEFENQKFENMTEEKALQVINENAWVDYTRLQAFVYLGQAIKSLEEKLDLPVIEDMISFVSQALKQINVQESSQTKKAIYESINTDKREELIETCKKQIKQENKTFINKPYGYIFESILIDLIIYQLEFAIISHNQEKWEEDYQNEQHLSDILSEIAIETNTECYDKDITYCRKKYLWIAELFRLLQRNIGWVYQDLFDIEGNDDKVDYIEQKILKKQQRISQRTRFKSMLSMRYSHQNYRNWVNAISAYNNTIFASPSKYEQYSIENRSKVAQAYFHHIDWTEIPYDDPICLYPDKFMLKDNTKNDFAIEVNKIEHKNTLAAIKIADFETYMKDERKMNILKTALQTTNREQKLQEIETRYLIDDDQCVTKHFQNYGIVWVHTDGSLSVNWYHKDSLEFLLPEWWYEVLQTYIYKYILECTQIIDKRDVKDPEQILQGIHEDGDFNRKDPRSVYDFDHNEWTSVRIVDHRDTHKRLLPKKMMPWAKWFANAGFYKKELYAEVYPHNHDSRIDKPMYKVRINESDDYQECIELCKELKDLYNTSDTVIRFETCIKEFSRTPESERKVKMNTVWSVGNDIKSQLEQAIT